MKKGEKVLLIIGAFFALAALLIAVFAAYFGIDLYFVCYD